MTHTYSISIKSQSFIAYNNRFPIVIVKNIIIIYYHVKNNNVYNIISINIKSY